MQLLSFVILVKIVKELLTKKVYDVCVNADVSFKIKAALSFPVKKQNVQFHFLWVS